MKPLRRFLRMRMLSFFVIITHKIIKITHNTPRELRLRSYHTKKIPCLTSPLPLRKTIITMMSMWFRDDSVTSHIIWCFHKIVRSPALPCLYTEKLLEKSNFEESSSILLLTEKVSDKNRKSGLWVFNISPSTRISRWVLRPRQFQRKRVIENGWLA